MNAFGAGLNSDDEVEVAPELKPDRSCGRGCEGEDAEQESQTHRQALGDQEEATFINPISNTTTNQRKQKER